MYSRLLSHCCSVKQERQLAHFSRDLRGTSRASSLALYYLPPRSARYVLTAPAPQEPVAHLLPFPLAARHRDLPNAAPPAVVEPGQECVLQLQLLPLRLVLFSPSVGEL